MIHDPGLQIFRLGSEPIPGFYWNDDFASPCQVVEPLLVHGLEIPADLVLPEGKFRVVNDGGWNVIAGTDESNCGLASIALEVSSGHEVRIVEDRTTATILRHGYGLTRSNRNKIIGLLALIRFDQRLTLMTTKSGKNTHLHVSVWTGTDVRTDRVKAIETTRERPEAQLQKLSLVAS